MNVIKLCAKWLKMAYNTFMSTLPILCPSCGYENMVDVESLESHPVDRVASRLGIKCPECDAWVTFSYTTRSLENALKKLASRSTNSAGYHYHFAKVLKKCEGVQEKYGGF